MIKVKGYYKMEMNINKNELVELCKEFIDVPSPVSYYEEVFPLLEKKLLNLD